MDLGKKIKALRAKSKLTQEQLADRLGINAQSVSKWENSVTLPDITTLPLLAETFGVTIDDLFDLSTEQRLNRIESRIDIGSELSGEVFAEYEVFLKELTGDKEHKKRATELLAYLYWHKMDVYSKKVKKYAKEAIELYPEEKYCQWMLDYAMSSACWDWDISNHSKIIDFYKEVVEKNPKTRLPYLYLIDYLIADRRTGEAEKYLKTLSTLKDANPIMNEVYKAHIMLARFDEKGADAVINEVLSNHPTDPAALFEAAQYFAKKGDYERTIELYEQSFMRSTRKPRYTDELLAIADIYRITGEYKKAADTYDRIIALLKGEWNFKEEVELQEAIEERNRMLGLAKR